MPKTQQGNSTLKSSFKQRGEFANWRFTPLPGVRYAYDYNTYLDDAFAKTERFSPEIKEEKRRLVLQFLCRHDLFFLLYFALDRKDLNEEAHAAEFVVDRCNEVQRCRDRTLDLWSREHYKTTITSIGATIQDILIDPESATGIFSYNKALAKAIVQSIRVCLESPRLISWFPEVLYANPAQQAPLWGLDSGLVVKRKTTRLDATVEACGLIDGMPTGRHFDHRCYDDVVTEDTVDTPEQIEKVKGRFRLSHSLGRRKVGTARIAGTTYHYDDAYMEMRESGMWISRIQTCYGGEATDGTPVLFTEDELEQRRADHGPYGFSCQYLLSPVIPGRQQLKLEWVKFYDLAPTNLNVYIIADPANEKKRSRRHDPDFTSIWVVGYAPHGYVYVLDGYWGRINLEERWQHLARLVRKWSPQCVGWEEYGKDSDIQHFEYRMNLENIRFPLVKLAGSTSKSNRISGLVPTMCQGKLLLPRDGIVVLDSERNERINLIDVLVDVEMSKWPFSAHDDMLDCLSRLEDRDTLGVIEPYDNESMTGRERLYDVEKYRLPVSHEMCL